LVIFKQLLAKLCVKTCGRGRKWSNNKDMRARFKQNVATGLIEQRQERNDQARSAMSDRERSACAVDSFLASLQAKVVFMDGSAFVMDDDTH
jgi:hypothetical protein